MKYRLIYTKNNFFTLSLSLSLSLSLFHGCSLLVTRWCKMTLNRRKVDVYIIVSSGWILLSHNPIRIQISDSSVHWLRLRPVPALPLYYLILVVLHILYNASGVGGSFEFCYKVLKRVGWVSLNVIKQKKICFKSFLQFTLYLISLHSNFEPYIANFKMCYFTKSILLN